MDVSTKTFCVEGERDMDDNIFPGSPTKVYLYLSLELKWGMIDLSKSATRMRETHNHISLYIFYEPYTPNY